MNASEASLELSVPTDDAPMNSTGIVNKEVDGLVSPIKADEVDKDDEDWIRSFLDVMDSDGDDESTYNKLKSLN